MDTKGFTYFAFVSYSHKDHEIAKKLKKFLEKYKLPAKLRKNNPGLPRNLNPVFIDESNLVGPGPLKKNLYENLETSKYLIVICSPNSAKSEYVNDEVDYFIKNGRINRIIPLIVDGTPHSDDPSKECFTPAILNLPRELEPLGIDLKTHKERGAFLRVIAAMLELKPGKFIPWIEIERIKKIALFSSLAAALVIAAGIFVWHNLIPHHHYYHTYVYKWGKPVGLFEVTSESDRMKMEYTYRFTTLRGKVQMIERINSAGTLVDPNITTTTPLLEPPMIRFVSDREVEYYDLYKHKLYRKVYASDMRAVDFRSAGERDFAYALPSDIHSKYNANLFNAFYKIGSITRKTLEYDKNGYVIKEMFRRDNSGGRDRKGTPAQDKNGIWGFSYKVDELGRITEFQHLDKNGEAMPVKGIYATHMKYEDSPYPVKISYFDKKGNFVLSSEGAAFYTIVYDEYFNAEKVSFHDADGKRLSETVYTYDANRGFLTSYSYYDAELAPKICGNGYFRAEYIRNKEGRIVEWYCYDTDGKKVICSNGYAGVHTDYDDDGHILSMTFVDTENKPAIDFFDNTYGLKLSYEDGLKTRGDYLDSEGNLMLNKNGFASMIVAYSKEDKTFAGLTYLDTEGKKILSSNGHAEWRVICIERNQSSQIYSYTYYDEHGRQITHASGVAEIIDEWKDGNLISVKNFDLTGNPTFNAQGFARVEQEYDENGLKIWTRYYGTDGKRVNIPDGYSAFNYTYDSRGNQTSITYYDAEDHYAIQTEEYYCYAKKYYYDDNGNIEHIQYIGEEDSPYPDMLDRQVKDIYIEYDKRGNETKRYWLNSKGEEVDSSSNPNGNTRREREYDIYGRMCKESWFGRGEKEARTIKEYKHDPFGRVIATYTITSSNGKQNILVERKEYDKYGNCCKTYYLDGDNKLTVPGNNFYAVKKTRHNIFGRETDTWYYDAEEKPLSTDKQAFHTVRTYDVKGNILTESYYNDENEDEPTELSKTYYSAGNNDEPMNLSAKFHKIVRQYDASGHATEILLYGTDGNMIRHTLITHNSFGKTASLKTYDSDGKPFVDGEAGAFKVVFAYDNYGNISDVRCFDAEDAPCQAVHDGIDTGVHHVKVSYNIMGKLLSVEAFNTEEKPTLYNGVHKAVGIYDTYGLLIERAGYNEKQQLIKRRLYKYDSEGNEIEEERVE